MISFRRAPSALRLRLHHMFLDAPGAGGAGGGRLRRAWQVRGRAGARRVHPAGAAADPPGARRHRRALLARGSLLPPRGDPRPAQRALLPGRGAGDHRLGTGPRDAGAGSPFAWGSTTTRPGRSGSTPRSTTPRCRASSWSSSSSTRCSTSSSPARTDRAVGCTIRGPSATGSGLIRCMRRPSPGSGRISGRFASQAVLRTIGGAGLRRAQSRRHWVRSYATRQDRLYPRSRLRKQMLEALLADGRGPAQLQPRHPRPARPDALDLLRAASLKVRKAVGILGDLQGPKIRTGRLTEGQVELIARRRASPSPPTRACPGRRSWSPPPIPSSPRT